MSDRKWLEARRERLKDEIGTFMKQGADERLARVMSGLFGPIGYSPTRRSLAERVQQADDALDFQYLGFAMLLKGETEQAREYMRRAVELDPQPGRRTILKNMDKVQEIVTASRADFDQLRTEKYQLKPLEDYLV